MTHLWWMWGGDGNWVWSLNCAHLSQHQTLTLSILWVQSSCVTWHINKLTPSLLPLSSNHGGEWGGTDASAANEEKCVWSNENQFDVVVTLVSVTHQILFWWHTFFALFIIRNVRVGSERKDFTDTLVLCLVYTWFWMNHLDKQDWMSPHPWAGARNSDTVTPLIRADSNVGAALIHSAFRDIASLTRWEPDKMESQIFDIWPWHCLLQNLIIPRYLLRNAVL